MNTFDTSIVGQILNSNNRFWEPADFSQSPSRVLHVLGEMVVEGELRRIRRGLYWRGTATPLGMSPPPAEAILAKVVGKDGVGPSGIYAAYVLRLSTQIPRLPEYAVPVRIPENLPGMIIRSRAARWKRRDAKLRPTEIALLEVLEGWSNLIEVSDAKAMKTLQRLLKDGDVRATALQVGAGTEPIQVQRRLESLLMSTT
jgi:hypothetical protein